MNALRELRPNAWIAWGGLFLAAFCGIYDTLLWYVMSEMTGPMIVNAVVLNAAAITLAALDIYTKRTRSDAEASAEPQAVETQSGAEAPPRDSQSTPDRRVVCRCHHSQASVGKRARGFGGMVP
jgi:hypothetical protein